MNHSLHLFTVIIKSWYLNIRRRYMLFKMRSYKYKYGIGDTVICVCKSFWLDLSTDPNNDDRIFNKPGLILSIEPLEGIPSPRYRVLIGDRKMVLSEMWLQPIIKDSNDV